MVLRGFARALSRKGLIASAMGVLAALCAAGLPSAERRMVVKPFENATFVPVNPARPTGAQLAVLSGDPARGPSVILLKMKRTEGLLHSHSSDYHSVVIQGTATHRAKGETPSSVPTLGPGSYWFQPATEPHADGCLSEECIIYVAWSGKMDVTLEEAR